MARLRGACPRDLRRSHFAERYPRRSRALLSVYADSSFVVSLYINDIHSAEARRRVQGAPPLILTPFHRAEWFHALGQHQFRGTVTAEDAARLLSQFMSDEDSGLFLHRTLPEKAFDICADLAR